MRKKDWHKLGLEMGQKIWGKRYFKDLEKRLEETHPLIRDLALLAFSIYGRPGLDPKTRELCQIACLTSLKIFESPLRSHVIGALNKGASQTEIEEVILQMAPYAGLPASRYAMETAKKVFAEYKSYKSVADIPFPPKIRIGITGYNSE